MSEPLNTENIGDSRASTWSRRRLLRTAGSGFGLLALADLMGREGLLADEAEPPTPPTSPLAPKPPHYEAKAKAVIWLFMEGGPSAMDTFDPKPELTRHHGQQPSTSIDVFFGSPGPLMDSPFTFRRYGQSGTPVCDRLPHLASCVDDIALIKSCFAESPAHGPAMYQMNTGLTRIGFPSVGSWVTYGLGSENQDLPGFVVLPNTRGSKGGANNWGAGFLPGAYQATNFRSQGTPILNLEPPRDLGRRRQRALLDVAGQLNRAHADRYPGDPELQARIESYELAYRMQSEALNAVDLKAEPSHISELYGLDDEVSRPFGRKCLMARRLVERGVRFVQVYCNDEWDAHSGLDRNHTQRCRETDKPIAGLLTDLKQRGLLDETLVVWGGEFGRMPVSEKGKGRDHNPYGFLTWMAGGGVQGGASHGETDEIGYRAAVDPVSVHDLHATILHLLGLDHKRLTYLHNGRRFRLTDVAGKVINSILT